MLALAIEVLERGTPPAVAGEPIGYLYCGGSYGDELADWEIVADQHQCDKLNEYHGSLGKEARLPLYTTPQPTQAQAGAVPLSDDTERLDWLLWKLPGDALRYVVGELADTSCGAEFRAAIDAAMRCFCCSKLGDEIEIPKELT